MNKELEKGNHKVFLKLVARIVLHILQSLSWNVKL